MPGIDDVDRQFRRASTFDPDPERVGQRYRARLIAEGKSEAEADAMLALLRGELVEMEATAAERGVRGPAGADDALDDAVASDKIEHTAEFALGRIVGREEMRATLENRREVRRQALGLAVQIAPLWLPASPQALFQDAAKIERYLLGEGATVTSKAASVDSDPPKPPAKME